MTLLSIQLLLQVIGYFRRRDGRAMTRPLDRPSLRRLDIAGDVLRHADRVRARRGRDLVHDRVHAGIVGRYDHAERLRGDGVDHAALDPAVHPQGRGDRPLARRARISTARCMPGCTASRAGSASPMCSPARCSRRWPALARDLLGDRLRRHPGDAQARLFRRLRGRHHRRRRHARHPAAAVDHDDPLCGRGRAVARAAVPRRDRSRACCWSRCLRAMPRGRFRREFHEAERRFAADRRDLGNPAARRTVDAGQVRAAAARPAVRDPAHRRDDRALRRLRDAVGNRRPRRRARARADRRASTASGRRATSSRSWSRRCASRPC